KAGGGNTAARHAVLRPDASRVFSEQWAYAHRRCRRRLPGSPHKREGDRGQGRAPHRSAYRVPLFGAAAQHPCAEPHNFTYRNRALQGVQAPALFMKDDIMNTLENVGWHPVGHEAFASFRDVTRFMLARPIALRQGTANGDSPPFYWAKNARRIGICRQAFGPT